MSLSVEQARETLQEIARLPEGDQQGRLDGATHPHHIHWLAAGIALTGTKTVFFDSYIQKTQETVGRVSELQAKIPNLEGIHGEMSALVTAVKVADLAASRTDLLQEAIVAQLVGFDARYLQTTQRADQLKNPLAVIIRILGSDSKEKSLDAFSPLFLDHWEAWNIAPSRLMQRCLQNFQHWRWEGVQAAMGWEKKWNALIALNVQYHQERCKLLKKAGPYQPPPKPIWKISRYSLSKRVQAPPHTSAVHWVTVALSIVAKAASFPVGFSFTRENLKSQFSTTMEQATKIDNHRIQLVQFQQSISNRLDAIKNKGNDDDDGIARPILISLTTLQQQLKTSNSTFFELAKAYEGELAKLQRWFATSNPWKSSDHQAHRNALISMGFFSPGSADAHIRSVTSEYERYQAACAKSKSSCAPIVLQQQQAIVDFNTLAWTLDRKVYPQGVLEGTYFNLCQWFTRSYFHLPPVQLPKDTVKDEL